MQPVPSVSPMSPGAKQGHEGHLQVCWFEGLDFQQTGTQPSILIDFHIADVRQLPLGAALCEAPWFPLDPIVSDPDPPMPLRITSVPCWCGSHLPCGGFPPETS